MNTKKCPKCNNDIPDGAAFCPVCFTVLKEASSPVVRKSHAGLIKTIIFIVAILLIALFVICGFVCCDEDSSHVTEKPTATADPETTPEIIIENTQAPDFQQGLSQNNPLIPEITPTATPLPGLPGNPVSQGNTNNSSNIKPIATSNPGNNTVSPVLPTPKPVIPGNNNILPSFPTITLPTAAPTTRPTAVPTVRPTATAIPTNRPTSTPAPTATPTQTPPAAPTTAPTQAPVVDETLWAYSGNTITKYNGTEVEVTIPETLGGNKITSIGRALTGSSIKTIHIPASINYIDNEAFAYITDLKSITVSSDNEYFYAEDGVLFSLSAVVNGQVIKRDNPALHCYPRSKTNTTYTIPQGVVSTIGNSFMGNKYIETITFPEGFLSIGTSSFQGCTSLKNINFNEDLNTICDSAFSSCGALCEIYFPSQIKQIYSKSFSSCPQLTMLVEEGSYAHNFAVKYNTNFKLVP